MRITAWELIIWLESLKEDAVLDVQLIPPNDKAVEEETSEIPKRRGRPRKSASWSPQRRAAHGRKIRETKAKRKLEQAQQEDIARRQEEETHAD